MSNGPVCPHELLAWLKYRSNGQAHKHNIYQWRALNSVRFLSNLHFAETFLCC